MFIHGLGYVKGSIDYDNDLTCAYLFLCGYRFVESIDIHVQDHVAHKHIPYVVILVKMAEEWAQSHGGTLPLTREEKKEFKV